MRGYLLNIKILLSTHYISVNKTFLVLVVSEHSVAVEFEKMIFLAGTIKYASNVVEILIVDGTLTTFNHKFDVGLFVSAKLSRVATFAEI